MSLSHNRFYAFIRHTLCAGGVLSTIALASSGTGAIALPRQIPNAIEAIAGSGMQQFVFLFRQGTAQLSEEDQNRRFEEVRAWASHQRDDGRTLDPRLLSEEGRVVTAAGRRVTAPQDTHGDLVAIVFLEASDFAEALKIAETHPGLRYGVTIEVRGWDSPPGSTAAPTDQARAIPPTTRVHTYVSSELGILTNAYLVETNEGIVAVDTTLTVSDARALRERLDALHQPLLAVLVTHGHPDHYNGVTQLVAGMSVPIVATAGVDRVIREWDGAKEQQWKSTFGDEWPAHRTFPNRTVRDGESLSFGGVRFTAHELGPGESHHDAYWVADDGTTRIAFVGDLVFNGEHAYVSDGHTGRWLENLETARSALAEVDRLYPGHGADGGLELLGQQRRYLERYRETVRTLAGGRAALTDAEKTELMRVMTAFLPTGRLTFLINNGADAVAAEIAAGGASRNSSHANERRSGRQ